MSDGERWDSRRPKRPLRSSAAVTLIGGTSYVAMLVSVVRSILIMRLIGVRGRGIMRYVALIKGYLANATIGFRYGVSKKLPMAIGADDKEQAAAIEDAGFAAVTVGTAVAALGMLLWAVFVSAADQETRIALAIGAGILLGEEVIVLYWCVLRSWSSFGMLAVADLVRTVAQFALVVGGAALLGVTGAMLGWLAGVLVVLTYIHLVSRVLVRFSFDWAQMRHLLLVGLPVALISFSDMFLRSIDGTILVRYYGADQFGLYSVAMQMAAYLFALPQAAGFVIWPRVLEAYGAADQDGKTQRRVLAPTIVAAGIMPVVAGMASLAIPPAITLLLPKFSDAVPAAQVLGMGSVLLALPLATNSALVATNREGLVILAKLGGAALAGGLTWYLVANSAPLVQVAAAACLGFGLAAVLSLLLQFRDFYPELAARLREVVLCLLPLGWSLVALGAAAHVAGLMGLPASSVPGALVRMLVFLALCSPCLLYVHRRTHLGGELLRGLRGGFRR